MATGRKWDLIRQIRVAENVLGLEGPAKEGPLHRHTVEELRAVWKRLYRTLEEKGLLNKQRDAA